MKRFRIAAFAAVLLSLVTPSDAQDLFGRGDVDCNERRSAADAVAMVRSLAGSTTCANDDCDRDGILSDGDADCAVTCLFGDCLVPPFAPTVLEVQPLDDAIRPFRLLQVSGRNLAIDRVATRVVIDDTDAEILPGATSTKLTVLVPDIAPGLRMLRVFAGDLGGSPFPIFVEAQRPILPLDSFESALALLDVVLLRFPELPLEQLYGDDADLVRSAIDSFRQNLAVQLADLSQDPDFTPTLRAQLDAAIDSSGVADRLRESLAEIDELLPSARRRPRQGTLISKTLVEEFGKTLTISRGILTTGASGIAASSGIALGAGVLAGVLVVAANEGTAPIVTRVRVFDGRGNEVGNLAAKRIVRVDGSRLFATRLVIDTERGRFTVLADNDSSTARLFTLPDAAIGFCGRVTLSLERSLPVPRESSLLSTHICPSLKEIVGPNPTSPGEHVKIHSEAASGCFGSVRFEGPDHVEFVPFVGLSSSLIDVVIPNLVPDTYEVRAYVNSCGSQPIRGLVVRGSVTAIDVDCTNPGPRPESSILELPPGNPSRLTCSATLFPKGVRLPPGSRIVWSSSDSGTALLVGSNVGENVTVAANQPGETVIRAALMSGARTIVSSIYDVVVRDGQAPTVTLTSDAPTQVAAGGSIGLRVSARDNFLVSRVRLIAEGPVENGEQEFACLNLDESCSVDFTLRVQAGAAGGRITVRAEAFDGSGNKGTSTPLAFTVEAAPDTTCPEVFIESPVSDGVANAGTSVEVVARATDEVGVARFRYSATGAALVNQVTQELPLPTPLATANLRFSFSVKSAAALANISDRTITLRVEAFDAAGNSCGAETETLSVGGLWQECDGSISADKPIGVTGETVTVTAIVAGSAAARVNEVVGYNPGGTFDLMPRGGGRFTLALTYTGVGKFKFGFTALDHGDPVCEGAILLESKAR